MSNLTIQSSNNHLEFYFNDLSVEVGIIEDIWPFPIRMSKTTDGRIMLSGRFASSYMLSADGVNGSYQVDLVDNNQVTDTDNLFSLLETALGI